MERLRGEIIIRRCVPVTTNEIQVIFDFNDSVYFWTTTSWRAGTNITHSTRGQKYFVSFTDCGNKNVKNLRVLKNEQKS